MAREMTVGIAGAAGDGLDRVGETLARVAARLGLHVYTYNSYQSLIRGGHTWLRLRISERKVDNHGDHLNFLIALNQDSLERHAPEVEGGGAILFNSDKLSCDESLVRENVAMLPLSIKELTSDFGKLLPVMQNTVALGALLHISGLEVDIARELLAETFGHKGEQVVEQNVNVLRAGYEHASKEIEPRISGWEFSRKSRPVVTGNTMTAMGAVAGGLKLYSAYPMSPATSILHWFASHSEQVGVLVKQAEDELAVMNIAIGAGHAGVRSMCATSGGGFALMTEALGMAAMIEAPVVCVNVMRGGPSTGLPTKNEQGDLNQAFGASAGDFPRVIVAPKDATDCYWVSVESLNLAEAYQLPVIILSDLLLAEHRTTIDPDAIRPDVNIERGEFVTEISPEQANNGGYLRYKITESGVSPRGIPGQPGMVYVSGTDEHDEKGVLLSDEHTNPAIRRKMHEKRMRKMDGVLASLAPLELEGPADADVTLVGWGSTWGAIHEAAEQLNAAGTTTNQLHFRYIIPFQSEQALAILDNCKRTIMVENNFSGQFARHMRAECGFNVDDLITRYDGELIEPAWLATRVARKLSGEAEDLSVSESEAREMAYHYIRIRLKDKARPAACEVVTNGEHAEPVWKVEIVDRGGAGTQGTLIIGKDSGSMLKYQPVEN